MSMRVRKIRVAIREAERFIIKAKKAVQDIEEESKRLSYDDPHGPIASRAEARRASLDLTRALADMRRRGER